MNTAALETAEFITANCACTKESLLKIGGFDERFSLAWREDSDLHFRLLEHQIPITKAQQAVVIHPVRESSWGVSIKDQKKALFEALLFRKHPELYAKKIGRGMVWHYYLTNILWLLLFFAILNQHKPLMKITALTLGLAIIIFAAKRLRKTSKAPSHVLEMVITSILIPSLSIYWRIYGAFKFHTRFI